tara:strand:+ start:2599 stop:4659 length:2061 start_codon:yes stop_codon:yes gene_type:complete
MARDRDQYKQRLSTINVPTISAPQYREQANIFSELDQRLNSIREFALDKVLDDATKRGQEFALANPVNALDFLNADPLQKDKMLDADDSNAFSRAVNAARINQITTTLESYGFADVTDLFSQAVKTIGTPDEVGIRELEAVLQGTIDGYTNSLTRTDPESALALYSSLATKTQALYKSYADKVTEARLEKTQGESVTVATNILRTLKENILQDSVMEDGDTLYTWEMQLEANRNFIINKYQLAGMPDSSLKEMLIAFDTEAQLAAENKFFEEYIQTEKYWDKSKGSVQNAVEQHENLKQNKFLNPEQARLFNFINNKDAVITESKSNRDNIVKDFENERDLREQEATDRKAELQLELTEALNPNLTFEFSDDQSMESYVMQGPDFNRAQSIIDNIKQLARKNPEFYGEFYNTQKKRLEERSGTSNEYTYKNLYEGMIPGTTTLDMINEADLTIGKNSEHEALINYFYQVRKQGVTEAYNIVRRSLLLPSLLPDGSESDDINVLTDVEKQKAQIKLKLLEADLQDYINKNRSASGKQVQDYALEIVDTYTDQLVTLTGAEDIYKEINGISVGRVGTLTNNINFNNHLRNNFDPTFTNIKSYTQDKPENISMLIDWLDKYNDYGSMSTAEKTARGGAFNWKETENWSQVERMNGTRYKYEEIRGFEPNGANILELLMYLDDLQEYYTK